MWFTKAAATTLILICAAGPVFAEQPSASKTPYGYRIGPYPLPITEDGESATLWIWLTFTPVQEGRGNPIFKLKLSLEAKLDEIPPAAKRIVDKKYLSDNCGRIDAVDNWVYALDAPRFIVVDPHNLQLLAKGQIETWSCFRNPVPETVCDHYRDDVFNTDIPYNCTTRQGSPIKTRNLQQGFEVTKNFYASTSADGRLEIKDQKPIKDFLGQTLTTQILSFLDFVSGNLGAILANAYMTPQLIELSVPAEYRAFNPRYEDAGFKVDQNSVFLVVSASVSITAVQVNSFMRSRFGGLWTDLPASSGPARLDMTKQQLRSLCAERPQWSLTDCAAAAGFKYDELPD